MDCSPPGPSVNGILQARALGWGAMPSSRGSSHAGIKAASHVSCIGRRVLYHSCHLGSLISLYSQKEFCGFQWAFCWSEDLLNLSLLLLFLYSTGEGTRKGMPIFFLTFIWKKEIKCKEKSWRKLSIRRVKCGCIIRWRERSLSGETLSFPDPAEC